MMPDHLDAGGTAGAVTAALPRFAGTVLHVFCGRGCLGAALREGERRVFGVDRDAGAVEQAAEVLDGAAVLGEALPWPVGMFDVVMLTAVGRSIEAIGEALRGTLPWLSAQGWVVVLGGAREVGEEALLSGLGLRAYPVRFPREASRYTMVESHRKWRDPLEGEGMVWVRGDYDPVEHARRLSEAGHPEAAFEILDGMPAALLEDPAVRLLTLLEMQMALLAWGGEPEELPRRFFLAQYAFYQMLNLQPMLPAPYQCQAQFWRLLGDDGMARRLLRSIGHVTGDAGVAAQLARIPEGPDRPVRRIVPPVWDEGFLPRLLLINHPNADCGFDALYDGLCRTLGPGRVTEYPWKPFLHGQPTADNVRHPCACNHPGRPRRVEELEQALRAGQFDAVVFSDVFELLDREEVLRLAHANPAVPLVLLDTQDEGWDNRPRLLRYLERDSAAAHFKREMLTCVDYGPETFPLPLSYTDDRVRADFGGARPRDVFWAGHRHFGIRRIGLNHLERVLARSFEGFYEAEEYACALDEARIGSDFFGLGFDTVRYYELPAHGCMLLAERKPIHIPHDYEDGVSAVFFEDLPALEEKLRYYLDHPEEAESIARAGYAHMRAYHTSSARARQFLGWLGEALGG